MANGLQRFDLTGQVALVSGASRGIGAALARGLAEAGADLILAARSQNALSEIAADISALGRRAWALPLDVTDNTSIAKLFSELDNLGLTPTILVNNAGVEQVTPSLDISEQIWDHIVGTNLKGAFFLAQAFARRLVAAERGGAIVNLCSLTSVVGVPTAVPYTASKSGMVGITHALAAEWAGKGIRVNGLGPGYFRTELTESFYRDQVWADSMLGKIPLARFGELDDLVGAAIFLSSPASSYMTGQVIYVDGGYLASI